MARLNFNPVVEAIRLYRQRKPVSDQRIKLITELLKYFGARLSTQTVNTKISADLHITDTIHQMMVTGDPATLHALETVSLKLSEIERDARKQQFIDVTPALPEPESSQ